jgi:hypothetical protein
VLESTTFTEVSPLNFWTPAVEELLEPQPAVNATAIMRIVRRKVEKVKDEERRDELATGMDPSCNGLRDEDRGVSAGLKLRSESPNFASILCQAKLLPKCAESHGTQVKPDRQKQRASLGKPRGVVMMVIRVTPEISRSVLTA